METPMELHRRRRLIVSVDYGTTGTAVSHALVLDGEETVSPRSIDQWPPKAIGNLKVPSRISYRPPADPLWGFQIDPEMASFSWTKLLLARGSRTLYSDRFLDGLTDNGIMQLPEDKTAVDLVANYLGCIYQHAHHMVRTSYRGEQDNAEVEFHFTYPATWSTRDLHQLERAIRDAGFLDKPHSIFYVTEAEAAAYAVLYDNDLDIRFEIGDKVMIVDCGGGTVDITKYHIGETDPLSYVQLDAAVGARCGGAAVDSRFYELLQKKLGRPLTEYPLKVIGPSSTMMNGFEKAKEKFGSARRRPSNYHFDFPTGIDLSQTSSPDFFDRGHNKIRLYQHHMEEVSSPVIADIINFILHNVEGGINKIVLVGGFSTSTHFRDKVGAGIRQVHSEIRVAFSHHPQRAVAHGAVFRGFLHDLRQNYQCPHHYGLALPDNQEDRSLHWIMPKDATYPYGHEMTFNLTHVEGEDWVKFIKIYKCDISPQPKFLGEEGAEHVRNLRCDFGGVDLSRFPKNEISDGRHCYELEITVRASLATTGPSAWFTAYTLGQVKRREIGDELVDM